MSKSETKKIETPEPELEAPAPILFDEGGYCVAQGVRRIENNTERLITLTAVPSAPEFPLGVKLWPGLTTVPNKYLVALEESEPFEVMAAKLSPHADERAKYRPSTRRPGRDVLEHLLTPCKIVKADGVFFGPQITIYEPEQCDRPDGPPMPDTLLAYNETTALMLIERINDAKLLLQWAKAETDPRRVKVKNEATAKASLAR